MAFPAGWTRVAPIVIQAVDAPLVNFPAHLDQSCFPAEALNPSSANPARSDGGDLAFSTDSAGTNRIACEVVQWVQSTTTPLASVHVVVPALSYTGTTTIYVWYGNASATQPAPNAAFGSQAVWDSNYVGVYHLSNPASVPTSTATGVAGTLEGAAMSTAQTPVGLGLALNGSTNAINFGTTNYNDEIVEAVLKLTSTADQIIFGKSTAGSYSQSTWTIAGKPVAYFSTPGTVPYTYTYADTAADSTTAYEYWAVRNRSAAGGAVVSKALPTQQQTHMAWANDGTYLYSIGGHQGTITAPVTYNQRYSPAADTWTTLAPIPTARWGMASVYLAGNIYVFGGTTNSTAASSNTDIYSVSGNSWTSGAAMPSALTTAYIQGQRACTDGTNIYVFCGSNLYRYNVAANTWTALTSCPVATGSWQSLICDGTYIYAVGGYGLLTNVCQYTIASDTWNGSYDTAPYAAWAKVCEPVGDGTYLIGFGRNGSAEQYTYLYRYAPATKTWTRLPNYETPTNAVAAMIYSGVLYVYGFWVIGKLETYSSGHHAAYNIASTSWTTLPQTMEFHRDGVWISGNLENAAPFAGTGAQYLGRQDAYGSLYASAIVGEFRRSKSARSRAWIKATRTTLMAASTFAVVGAAGGASISAAIAEAGYATDATTINVTFALSCAEGGSAVDAAAAALSAAIAAADAALAADSASQTTGIGVIQAEAATPSDAGSMHLAAALTLAEAALAGDAPAAQLTAAVNVAEAALGADAVSETAGIGLVQAETARAADLETAAMSAPVAAAEAASAADAPGATMTAAAAAAESAAPADVSAVGQAVAAAVAESAAAVDAETATGAVALAIAEIASAQDSSAAAMAAAAAITEIAAAVDALGAGAQMALAASESTRPIDGSTAGTGILLTAQESASASDAILAAVRAIAAIAEAAQAADAAGASGSGVLAFSVAEFAQAIDSVASASGTVLALIKTADQQVYRAAVADAAVYRMTINEAA